MSPQRNQHQTHSEITLPAPYSYSMVSKDFFIPYNMRDGRPYRLIVSAVTLSNWARIYVKDVDSFLAYESAYCLIADDLDEALCPHNTVVRIFFNGLRKREQLQFRWFLHGFDFPRKFNHPLACQERHGAAMATFPDLMHNDDELRKYLILSGAEEISIQIGIDYLEVPAKRILLSDDDEMPYYPAYIDKHSTPKLYASPHPATPHLKIHHKLPKTETESPKLHSHSAPFSVRHILNAINIQRSMNDIGETSRLTYPPHGSPTLVAQDSDQIMEDKNSEWDYEGSTTDPLHPKSYDW
jgi:hypothetical protein